MRLQNLKIVNEILLMYLEMLDVSQQKQNERMSFNICFNTFACIFRTINFCSDATAKMPRITFYPNIFFAFVDPNSMYVSWVFRMQTYAKNAHTREINIQRSRKKKDFG